MNLHRASSYLRFWPQGHPAVTWEGPTVQSGSQERGKKKTNAVVSPVFHCSSIPALTTRNGPRSGFMVFCSLGSCCVRVNGARGWWWEVLRTVARLACKARSSIHPAGWEWQAWGLEGSGVRGFSPMEPTLAPGPERGASRRASYPRQCLLFATCASLGAHCRGGGCSLGSCRKGGVDILHRIAFFFKIH